MENSRMPQPKLVRIIKPSSNYNFPEVECKAFVLGGKYDVFFELVYDNFQIMVGCSLSEPFEILGFLSVGLMTPITAQDEQNKSIILTLLTIDLQKMATEVLAPGNTNNSNIIVGRK